MFQWGFQIDRGFEVAKEGSPDLFVSDYALYWFDYLVGYDVVLAQVGWNHSLAQDIALVRGAARLQGKNWGSIVTWKYTEPPYLDTGEGIYEQMCEAYEAGAKYVVLFNYPTSDDSDFGVLLDEHFDALDRFWTEVVQNPAKIHGGISSEAALVLPRNYGWGLRHPEDRIWGWFGPDEISSQIWTISRQLLHDYGLTLDIVYEDPAFPVEDVYEKVYCWNQTITSD